MIKDKIDYLRGVEYQSDMPQSIYHSYGRNILQVAYWEPEYHIKDHLGNVRVTFCDENSNGLIQGSERLSINDYYAYGMEWNNRYELSDTIAPGNKYRYNGKELFTEMDLDVLHYGARMMDPQLGRMMQPDPRAESFSSITPYQYGLNNPIMNIDPTGMYTQSYIKKADGTIEYAIPSAAYNAEMDRYGDNDDIIDIDKQTGSVTITQSSGNDVVRMVNDGKVESSYIYGQNGSFTAENKLVTGMEGQAILSTNSTKANQFFEFAANANVEFGIVDLKGGVSIVTTSHESRQTSTLPGIVKQFSKLGEIGIRQAHSHPATITHYNESVPSGYYDNEKGNPNSLMPDLRKGKSYGDAGNAVQVRKLKGFENTKFEVYAPGNKTKAIYDGVNKAKIEKY